MAIILKPNLLSLPDFYSACGDYGRTGQGAVKALQYAPCNPGFISVTLHIAEQHPVKTLTLGIPN
ncbi:hypothetical protein [Klebsiella oxytoca]|uniref:hypothetical protein n=1 Tax=Klebsiella oxytoca TaxID=571 RepID=UPI001CCCEC16|nr:hypothetical protein [Klebsiella oxytoca]MBZ7249830.1 hypothetical protein [Klebsiella oxytoca]